MFGLCTAVPLMAAEGELASRSYDGASPLVGLFVVLCILLNVIIIKKALRQARKAETWAVLFAATPGVLLGLGWYLPAIYRLLSY